jgi:hypothetical protein
LFDCPAFSFIRGFASRTGGNTHTHTHTHTQAHI